MFRDKIMNDTYLDDTFKRTNYEIYISKDNQNDYPKRKNWSTTIQLSKATK